MPEFVVVRGRDAWVIEEAKINAASAAEAEDQAAWRSVADTLEWKQTGDVRVFDDTQIMEQEARHDAGEKLEDRTMIAVTAAERDMILAALRLWQDVVNDGGAYITDELLDIATNDGAHELLDDTSIDDICETINV